MATQYNLTGSFVTITEESGTIQNIGYEAAELVSTTNAVEGEGIELLPGEKRTFNGAMKARSKGGANTTVNVVDFKDAAGGGGGSSYVLPVATASALGGVKSSSASGDVTVNADGTMTVNGSGSSYTLPEATASTLGGVKIGSNISVASDGTISLAQSDVTGALGYIPPQTDTTYSDATQSAAGLMSASDKMKLDGIASGANNYTLPVATTGVLGGVKSSSASGDVTVNADGTMTVNGSGSSYTLPEATASTLGGVKIGSNISVASDGTISLAQSDVTGALGYIPPQTDTTYSDATQSAAGLMSASDKMKLDGIASGANNYTLPVATTGVLGGVKSSSASGDVTVNADGTMTVNGGGGSSYTLPTASASTLGGIKVGDRLSIDANGVLSAADQSYSLPVADASTLGGVKVGTGLSIDANGVLSSYEMTGADSANDGVAGLVPQPKKTDVDKFLCADGKWKYAVAGVQVARVTLWEGNQSSSSTLTLNDSYTNYDVIEIYYYYPIGSRQDYGSEIFSKEQLDGTLLGNKLLVLGFDNKISEFVILSNTSIRFDYTSIAVTKIVGIKYIQPDSYSTAEKLIGTWIDGKPLYRKVFENVSNGSNLGLPYSQFGVKRIYGGSLAGDGSVFPLPNETNNVAILSSGYFDTNRSGSIDWIAVEYTKN